jgi:hypothetical protein
VWKSIKISLDELQATRNENVAWAVYTAPFEIDPNEGALMKGVSRHTDIFEEHGGSSTNLSRAPAPPPVPGKVSSISQGPREGRRTSISRRPADIEQAWLTCRTEA